MPADIKRLGSKFEVASRGVRRLGLRFNVSTIDTTGTPVAHEIFNQFDEFGLLLGLARLSGEKNDVYKRRLMDVFINKANSTYRGLINGITRELGLNITKAVTIRIRRNANNVPIGGNPAVEFDGPEVRVWGDIRNDEDPELTIDRFDMTLQTLITTINGSQYFTASVYSSSVGLNEPAMVVLNQSNLNTVTFENIPSSTRFELKHQNIINGSAFFSDSLAFHTEKTSVNDVLQDGDYSIDYVTGTVVVFRPAASAAVRYQHLTDPLYALASPVIIHNLQSTVFLQKVFEQIVQDDGTTTHGMVTELGSDLVNELLSVFPCYFAN